MICRRLFFTSVLFILTTGYMAALVNLYMTHHRTDGRNALSRQDIILNFHGSPDSSRLSIMINGPMRQYLKNDDEKSVIEFWCADGAPQEDYPEVAGILEEHCTKCHDEFGKAAFAPLTRYEEVARHARPYTGISWNRLARLSHQHLFGMGFIFFCLGFLSMKTGTVSPVQWIVLTAGLVFVFMDIGGWWITRIHPAGAWLVMVAGAGHALAFLIAVIYAVIRIWFRKDSVLQSG